MGSWNFLGVQHALHKAGARELLTCSSPSLTRPVTDLQRYVMVEVQWAPHVIFYFSGLEIRGNGRVIIVTVEEWHSASQFAAARALRATLAPRCLCE